MITLRVLLCILMFTASVSAGDSLIVDKMFVRGYYDGIMSGSASMTSVSAGEVVAHRHTASSEECTKYCSSSAGEDEFLVPFPGCRVTVYTPSGDRILLGPTVSAGDGITDNDIRYIGNIDWGGTADSSDTETIDCLIWVERPNGVVTVEIYDTLRYYAKVDTVSVEKKCWSEQTSCPDADYNQHWGCLVLHYKTVCEWRPTLDTTWHPKVQVWLTPAEIEKLMELVE